jgi:hypothetical protein
MKDGEGDDLNPGQLPGKDELMARMQRSRAALEETVNQLSEEQLSKPGKDGWAIKDHLAHLASWELGMAELLRGRPRYQAMHIAEAVSQGKDARELNDLIYQHHADLSTAEALEFFHDTHRKMLAALEPLEDRDIHLPYASYTDEEGSDVYQEPVFFWIVGNTLGHFDEHHAYIKKYILGSSD